MKKTLTALASIAGLLVLAACALGATPAAAQNTPCFMENQGGRWEIGSGCTLDVATGGVFSMNGLAQPKIASGVTALSGTNPTTVITGLASITSCQLTIKTATAPGVSTEVATYTTSGGTLSMYGWKPTSSSNPTLIASTGTTPSPGTVSAPDAGGPPILNIRKESAVKVTVLKSFPYAHDGVRVRTLAENAIETVRDELWPALRPRVSSSGRKGRRRRGADRSDRSDGIDRTPAVRALPPRRPPRPRPRPDVGLGG